MHLSHETRRKILWAQENSKPLTIKTYSFLPKAQTYIDHMLQVFLEEIGLTQILDQLSFCIKELAVNAKKANAKRIYFEERSLDVRDPRQYAKGMEAFKAEVLNNQAHYLEKLKERNYYVKIEFLRYKGFCSVAVRNNVELLPLESERIHAKIRQAHKYSSLEEAFNEASDETEGAGLGLLVLLLMLKNLGFGPNCFRIYTRQGETVARIILPVFEDTDAQAV